MGSLAATLCQGRGWVEFWFVWIAVDVVGVPLAFHSGLPVSGFTYGIYFVLVIAGLRQWIRLARREPAADPRRVRPRRRRSARMNGTLEVTATGLDTIETALLEIAAGRPVVVVDDEDRENEGDIIFAAEHATPELLAFTVRYSSGVICAPM